MGDKNKSNTHDAGGWRGKLKKFTFTNNKYESQLTEAEKQEDPERAKKLEKERTEQAGKLTKTGIGLLRKLDIVGLEKSGKAMANLNDEAEKIKNSGGSNTDQALHVGKSFFKAAGSVAWEATKVSTGATIVPNLVGQSLKSESVNKFIPEGVQKYTRNADGTMQWITDPRETLIKKAKGMARTKGPASVNQILDIKENIENFNNKSNTELIQDGIHFFKNKKGKVNVRESEVAHAAKLHAEKVIVGGKAYKAPKTATEWNNAVKHSIRVHVDLTFQHVAAKLNMPVDWLTKKTRNKFVDALFKLYLDEASKVNLPGERFLYSEEVIKANEADTDTNFPTVTHAILKTYSSVETIKEFIEVYGNSEGKIQLERMSMAYLKYLSYGGLLDIPRNSETSTQSLNEGTDELVTDKLDGSGQIVTKIIPDTSDLPFQEGETFFKVKFLGENGEKLQELEFSEYLGDLCEDSSYCPDCVERDYIMDINEEAGEFHADWQLNGNLHIRFYVEGLVDEYGNLSRRGYRFPSEQVTVSKQSVKQIKLVIDKNKSAPDIT